MTNIENQNTGGIIYILTNLAIPGYIKIGRTNTSVEQRVLELSRSTSIPLPFECCYAAEVQDVNKTEAGLHDAFGDHRVNPKREFFEIAPERVVAILRLLAIREVTPTKNLAVETKEDEAAIEAALKRRSAFNFRMVDIPAGSELAFIRDENIKCVVATDQKHVDYQGNIMSISSAAQKALGRKRLVQGPAYWTYGDEILDERRIRFEAGISYSNKEIEAAGDQWMQQEEEISIGK